MDSELAEKCSEIDNRIIVRAGPVPSPPPPSPPTERDSMYDPQIGGSTVMVNPSLHEPSTITSFDDKRLSPRLSKTPLSATDEETRWVQEIPLSISIFTDRRQDVNERPLAHAGTSDHPLVQLFI